MAAADFEQFQARGRPVNQMEPKMSAKCLSLVFAAKLLLSGLIAGPIQESENVSPPAAESVPYVESQSNEEMIRMASENYVKAFNARAVDDLAQLWSENGVYELPGTGQQLKGRDAIREMFMELFAASSSAQINIEIDSIRMVTPDVATESGVATVVLPDSISRSRYAAIYVKQDQQWLLDSIHESDLMEPGTESSPLADLEWMIGEWIDQSDDSTVVTKCQWTANGKFLTRNFIVSAPGVEDLSGTQVIGWNPVSQQIQSWVFDSDGGVSEGLWSRKGANWVVTSAGFLSDGSGVQSVQVFAPVDDNSFMWQSFGRQVGDERLPDIREVRVVRK